MTVSLLAGCGSAPAPTGFRCVDDSGTPVEGVVLTVCQGDACSSMTTGTDGTVLAEDPTADYTATVFSVPDGYIFDDTVYSSRKGEIVDVAVFVKTGPSEEELAALEAAVSEARARMYPTDGSQLDVAAALAAIQEFADAEYPEYAEAAYLYGYLKSVGVQDQDREYTTAIPYLRRAADAGSLPGKAALGCVYMRLDGEEKDCGLGTALIDEALSGGLLDMSDAELGPDGMMMIGDIYGSSILLRQDYAAAMEWYQKASDAGNAYGTHAVGYYYYKGWGVEKDWARAAEYYEKAGDAGFGPGYSLLGDLYYYGGSGIEQDYAASMEWFKKGAELGDAYGMLSAGYNYSMGYGVEKDPAAGMEWYLKAAESGKRGDAVQNAISNIGCHYYYGDGVEQDYEKALEWFLKTDKYPQSYQVLGVMYYNGYGVEKNMSEALRCFLKAENLYLSQDEDGGLDNSTEWIVYMLKNGEGTQGRDLSYYASSFEGAAKGNAEDMFMVGQLFGHLYNSGFETDYDAAYKWYEKAADAGDARGMFWIGHMYQFGDGMTANSAMAAKWYEKAYDAGGTYAAASLGDLYAGFYAGASETDPAKALEWYNKGADAGEARAYVGLGRLYANGSGVEQDYEKAEEYFLKAYEAGDTSVIAEIGSMYAFGSGVEADPEKAIEWYSKNKDGYGDYLIGQMYFYGNGVEKDEDKGLEYFRAAIDKGFWINEFDEIGLGHDGSYDPKS